MTEEHPKLSEKELAEIGAKSAKTRKAMRASGGASAGDAKAYLNYILDKWDKPPVDIKNPQKVERRIKKYFTDAAENDMKPTLMGVCNSLPITKATFHEWLRGKNCMKEHTEIAQKAMSVLEEFWEISYSNGKIPSDTGKFFGERLFGYTSVSEVILTPNNPLDPQKTEKELLDIYGKNVVSELDEDSVFVRTTDEKE